MRSITRARSCQVTLYIIASAGFGQRISWKDEKDVPPGYHMSFKDSIHVVSTKVFFKIITPRWVSGLTAGLRHLRDGFDDFDVRDFVFGLSLQRRR
jgi:hypothetical protein